jgi:hypothetical protein
MAIKPRLQPTAGGLRNVSHCGETQLGWYRNELGTAWGCFYAKKVEPVDPVEVEIFRVEIPVEGFSGDPPKRVRGAF